MVLPAVLPQIVACSAVFAPLVSSFPAAFVCIHPPFPVQWSWEHRNGHWVYHQHGWRACRFLSRWRQSLSHLPILPYRQGRLQSQGLYQRSFPRPMAYTASLPPSLSFAPMAILRLPAVGRRWYWWQPFAWCSQWMISVFCPLSSCLSSSVPWKHWP